ncbi:MAG TPA: hypothetical protein DHW02_00840, partial [Ktedonobacter sp.]|nr:hypothetical protein [Ktedonobacter sp.]
ILCGLPFAGKTTLAKALVRELHLSRVSIDDLNTERGIWDDEKGLSSEEWTNVYNEAYRRLDALLSQGKSVLDDNANFTREQRDHLRVIAAKYQVPTTVIYVMTPLTEVRRRWQENRQTKVRNDVRDEDFALVVDSFEAPTDDEHVVCYDGVMT